MTDQDIILEDARVAIVEKRFDKARALLQSIPEHPTAQQWLAKLDEVAPKLSAEAPPAPAYEDVPPEQPSSPASAPLRTPAIDIDTDAARAQAQAMAGNVGNVLSRELAIIRSADYSQREDAIPEGSARRYPQLNRVRALLMVGTLVMLVLGLCNGLNQSFVGGIDFSTKIDLRPFSMLVSCFSIWAIALVMYGIAEFIKLGMKVEDHLHNQ
jgi:hypothetical protein